MYFDPITWEHSFARRWLNTDFLKQFNHDEQSQIIETRVENNDNPYLMISGGNDTNDKVFLLSLDEVLMYFGNSGELQRNAVEYANKGWTANEEDGVDVASFIC